ncbi:MAG TPA: hypothetical protein ENO27_03530 [Caldithrix sp.]|nr:hypothetical protein [Caldithrix sp.]
MANDEREIFLNILREKQFNIQSTIDISEFIILLHRHKLLPVGNEILQLLGSGDKQLLVTELKTWTIRSFFLSSELTNIIKELEKHSIKTIPLKGPVLSFQIYGDVSKRFYNDLDILVRDAGFENITDILEELGYRAIYPTRSIRNNVNREIILAQRDDIGFYNTKKNISLEIHFGIYDNILLHSGDESILINNTIQIDYNGHKVRGLNYEEKFIYLCYHAAKHSFYRLCWIRDIASAIKKWDLNHNIVIDKAKSLGFERILGISLVLAHKYFNENIPEAYEPFIKKSLSIILMEKIHNRIISGPAKKKFREVFKLKNLLKFNRKIEDQIVITWLLIYFFIFFLKPGIKYKINYVTRLYKSMRINRQIAALQTD